MIKQPSLFKEYSLVYSGDPALALPENEEERLRALKVARETGAWEPLLRDGQQPTLFQVRPLIGAAFDYFVGESHRKRLTEAERCALALRICLHGIVNFGEYKVSRMIDPVYGQELATTTILDAIYTETGEHGRRIVQELGAYLVAKAVETLGPN